MSTSPPAFSRRSRCRKFIQLKWQAVAPGRRAWTGAALGLALAGVALTLVIAINAFTGHGVAITGGGFLLFVLLAGGAAFLFNILLDVLVRVPCYYRISLFAVILFFALAFTSITPAGVSLLAGVYILTASLLGAGIWIGIHGGLHTLTRARQFIFIGGFTLGLVGLAGILFWVGDWRSGAVANMPEQSSSPLPAAFADLPDPAAPGPFAIQTWTYGSGKDLHRPEFGTEVDLPTDPVNGRPFVSGWSRLRTQFWGFDTGELPLNGRVWMPEGDGPFPLVLLVHGNHNMADFSDTGYAYLGELFASHGMIAVSVDQNFLNGSIYADMMDQEDLERENDARAFLLLEHLRQWRDWNRDESSPFSGRVNLDNVALIGHSRGGEAVAIAAAFNRLPRYPDNANIIFDYHFGIRAVAAIAPVDGQYDPAGNPTALEDINYLVLHGLNDGDVSSYYGSDQYARATFTGADSTLFKAGVYIAGANHGQFNTTWGDFDFAPPDGYALNRAALLDPAEQRRIAQVYLQAFLQSTLLGNPEYRPLFQGPVHDIGWLPETPLRTQYSDAVTRLVVTYSEDVDVTTTTPTLPGGRITGDKLELWQEYRLRSKNGLHDNSVVYLGWQQPGIAGPAEYTLEIPVSSLTLTEMDSLVLSVGDARDPAGADEPLDFTLRLVDENGESADLPLSHVSPVPLPLSAQLTRLALMSDLPDSEIILQTMAFPLADFVAVNPEFDPAGLTTISFLFNRSPAGRIVLDDVGFRPGN